MENGEESCRWAVPGSIGHPDHPGVRAAVGHNRRPRSAAAAAAAAWLTLSTVNLLAPSLLCYQNACVMERGVQQNDSTGIGYRRRSPCGPP